MSTTTPDAVAAASHGAACSPSRSRSVRSWFPEQTATRVRSASFARGTAATTGIWAAQGHGRRDVEEVTDQHDQLVVRRPFQEPVELAHVVVDVAHDEDRAAGGAGHPAASSARQSTTGHVAPEALEVVELAGFVEEDVDDEVAVVEQHPLGGVEALDPERLAARPPRRPRLRSPRPPLGPGGCSSLR